MSGGEQQMLAIGRALMADPKLLLLDEPSMGIAPILVERIYETIAEINQQGTTILLVEQNANFALGVSKRGYVLETGPGRADRRRPTRCARTPRSRRRTWAHDRRPRSHRAPRRSTCCTPGWPRRSSPRSCPTARATARRPGLAAGLLLSVVGVIIWLVLAGPAGLALEAPGAVRQGGGKTVAEARAEREAEDGTEMVRSPRRTCRHRCTRRSWCCSPCTPCSTILAGPGALARRPRAGRPLRRTSRSRVVLRGGRVRGRAPDHRQSSATRAASPT